LLAGSTSAQFLEAVEDEVEAKLELGVVLVGSGDVLRGHLHEVRIIRGWEVGQLLLIVRLAWTWPKATSPAPTTARVLAESHRT
jgi:hypothetical protein